MNGIHVAHHRQHHVGRGVERLVTVIQRLCRDVGDALHRSGNAGPGGAVPVQSPHHTDVDLPVGVVLHHADLLTDDALLLSHALLGEIGNGHKGQQNFKVFLKVVGGVEIIAGHGVGGKRVGLRAVLRQLLEGVALLGVEHLVLQIVGDARRSVQPLAVQAEAGVHAAVSGGEKGVFLGVAGLGHHVNLQSVGQGLPVDGLSQPLVKALLHSAVSFPRRKYTVSSSTDFMALKMRSGVTFRACSASSSGVSDCPVAA